MAIRKLEIQKTKLIVAPTPYKFKGIGLAKLDQAAERDVRMLHMYLLANFAELWPHGDYAPAYAYAKFLGMHRISYNQWSLAFWSMGLMELGPSVKTDVPAYERDHPAYNPLLTKTIAVFRPRHIDDVGGEPTSVEVDIVPFDPYNIDDCRAYEKHFCSDIGPKNVIRYIDRYYQSTLDEKLYVLGKRRKYKDGTYFAPIRVLSDGIKNEDRLYEAENRKHEISKACRVNSIEEAKNRVPPVFVPAHKGQMPKYLRQVMNPVKPLPAKKRPK